MWECHPFHFGNLGSSTSNPTNAPISSNSKSWKIWSNGLNGGGSSMVQVMAPNVAWETCDIKDVGSSGFTKATTPRLLVEKST